MCALEAVFERACPALAHFCRELALVQTIDATSVILWSMNLSTIPLASALEGLPRGDIAKARLATYPGGFDRSAKKKALVRAVLSRFSDLPPKELRFIASKEGKPVLDSHPGLHFNVSQSGDWLVVAVSGAPVGIDTALIRDDLDLWHIARTFYHPRELAALQGRSNSVRRDLFFRIWTRKEACVKGAGIGIDEGFPSFDTKVENDACQVSDENKHLGSATWHVWQLSAPPAYRAALAATRSDIRITAFGTDRSSPF